MEDQFYGVQFASYVRRRWGVVAISSLVAVMIAGGVCLMLPKRYTATASILIEPPAGNDPRSATAVSPVYLDSLKTYERFAASDTLFAAALNELGLQKKFGEASIESVKRSVLKVSRPTNTKIVEISATLDDPQSAQRLAQKMAEQSVLLNRKLNDQSTEDVLGGSKKTLELAIIRREKAEQAKSEIVKAEGIDALINEVADANQMRIGVERDLGKARAELADMEAQKKTFHAGDGMEAQAEWTARQIEALRASVASLEAQAVANAKASTEAATLLETRRQHREAVDSELRSAIADCELAKTRYSDAQNSASYRGERLEIMDPGIVPQHASFPDTQLSVLLALLFSLVASLGYLAISFGYSRARRFVQEPEYSLR